MGDRSQRPSAQTSRSDHIEPEGSSHCYPLVAQAVALPVPRDRGCGEAAGNGCVGAGGPPAEPCGAGAGGGAWNRAERGAVRGCGGSEAVGAGWGKAPGQAVPDGARSVQAPWLSPHDTLTPRSQDNQLLGLTSVRMASVLLRPAPRQGTTPSRATELRTSSTPSEPRSAVLTPASRSSHSFSEGSESRGGRGRAKDLPSDSTARCLTPGLKVAAWVTLDGLLLP